MEEKRELLIEELEKRVKKGSTSLNNGTLDALQKLMIESVSTYLQSYLEHDLSEVNRLLREQRRLRKTLTNEIRNYADQSIILYTKLVQTYNIFNKLVQSQERRDNFAENISIIEKRYSRAREVLVYLYQHVHVQHKELKETLRICPSTLSDLLNVLADIGCVEKIESGRCSFYNLTNDGRKYLREVHPYIDKELSVDRDRFRLGAQEIITEKENAAELYEQFYNREKIIFERIDRKWEDEAEAYVNIG